SLRRINTTVDHATHGAQYLLAGSLFRHIAVGSDRQHAFRKNSLVVNGQHQNPQPRKIGAYIPHQPDSIALIEANVSDNHLGIGLLDCGTCPADRICLPAYLQVVLMFDDPAQSLSNDWMLVDDQDSRRWAPPTGDTRRGRR